MVNGNRITSSGGDVQSVMPLEYGNVGLGLNFESSSYPLEKTSLVCNSSPYHHRHHYHHVSETFADEVMRASGKMLFTSTQWQELEMQTVIYKYIMASIPVPPQLLLSLSTQSNRSCMGLRFSNGSDPEPWRCRRTDGKKWRCSKDVAPDQKYCERHARKTRTRSRTPVETQSHNAKDYPNMLSAVNRQTECTDQWFMKNAGTSVYQHSNRFDQRPIHSPMGGSKRDQLLKQECSLTLSMQSGGNDLHFDHESFLMAVGMLSGDRDGCEDVFKPHHHWLNQASWAGLGSGSGLTPGGPLGEALCLGITSTRNEPSSHGCSYSTTTTSSSCDGGGLNFVNRHDD